jgi:hypothetical protein
MGGNGWPGFRKLAGFDCGVVTGFGPDGKVGGFGKAGVVGGRIGCVPEGISDGLAKDGGAGGGFPAGFNADIGAGFIGTLSLG